MIEALPFDRHCEARLIVAPHVQRHRRVLAQRRQFANGAGQRIFALAARGPVASVQQDMRGRDRPGDLGSGPETFRQLALQALAEALERWKKPAKFLLYTNHADRNLYPYGPAGTIELP